MCTVTYLPLSDGCIITSNRDEALAREPAEQPSTHHYKGQTLLFPQDPRGLGSWIASSKQASACLFNGAFKAHVSSPPYRHSRGKIPLEVLTHDSLVHFVENYELDGIEPFSIVVYQKGLLQELKWDGQRAHLLDHDPALPHIWASVTLYDAKVQAERQKAFEAWLHTGPDFTQDAVIRFHTQGSEDRENGLLIARKTGLTTVSVTSMKHHDGALSNMRYWDLLTTEQSSQTLQA